MDLDAIRNQFIEIEPKLHDLRDRVLAIVKEAAIEIPGGHVEFSCRVKDVNSFLTKVVRKGYSDPFSMMADKAGVRADVLYIHERASLVQMLSNHPGLEIVNSEDKLEQLGDDRLGYIGVHLDVRPKDGISGLDEQMTTCEIQIRTRAQAAWAMASHELIYKADSDPGAPIRRAMNRLSALVELFDEEVHRARDVVKGPDTDSIGSVIDLVEELHSKFRTLEHDHALTREVINSLMSGHSSTEIGVTKRRISEFTSENSSFIHALIDRYEGDARGSLLRQPESLLVFMLLERQRHELFKQWDADLPMPYLEQLAAIWGVNLPSPD